MNSLQPDVRDMTSQIVPSLLTIFKFFFTFSNLHNSATIYFINLLLSNHDEEIISSLCTKFY